jgi:hypothetical protein
MSGDRHIHEAASLQTASAESQRSPFIPSEDADRIAPVFDNGAQDGHDTTETQDSASADQQLMSKPTPDAKAVKASALPLLRYRRTSLCLLACYLPFLVLPWILTNIMAHRPPSLPSYFNQKGQYCQWKWLAILFWVAFVRILNSIASILTVPTTSALLAHGAVVYMQRRKRKPKQKLNLRQTFALSDYAWTDIPMLWKAYRGDGTGSKYLALAACLLTISKSCASMGPAQKANNLKASFKRPFNR